MTGSTISSISAAITAPPPSTEPPGPRPFRPGPRSPVWPLGHRPSWGRPSCALSRPEPIKLTVPRGHTVTVRGTNLRPWSQGDDNGLCGLFATVNAVRWLWPELGSGIRPWLRQQAVVPEPERNTFWDKLERKRQKYAEDPDAPAPPPRYKKVLLASLPPGSEEPEIWHRRAGLGSLGRPVGSQGPCGAVASRSGRRRPLYPPRGRGRRPHVPI